MTDKKDPQGTGEKFNLETYMEARKVARRIAFLFASHMDQGMSEEDGLHILDELFKKHNIEKKWHPSKFRIGKNTLKGFKEKSEPGIKLQKEDIYFIDIGPVINGHEADYGQTFTVGQNQDYAHAQKTSKKVFDELSSVWREKKVTGKELYREAKNLAKKYGYELNEDMQGHRLGDLPHAVHHKGKLGDFESTPVENLWMLEIHLRHPEKPFGAFFEDVLF
ncbi:MAG: M24 family metallopeptidase [Bacteriovoracaceae bacterium]